MARQIAGALATIEPQGPKLTGLVEGNPKLAASYDLAPHRTPSQPSGHRQYLTDAGSG